MHISKKGFDDEVMSSVLVDMYGKCDLLPEAYKVFSKMKDQDVVSWTSLIVGFAENAIHSEKAASCFRQMLLKGIPPDAFSIASALKCCIGSGFVEFGQLLHRLVFQFGYEDDEFVANMLVEMYAKCGLLVDALQAFEKLVVQGVMSWSVMITSYVDKGEHTKAFSLYDQMQNHGVPPDSMIFLGILRACSVMGTLQIGREVHTHVWKVGWDHGEVFLMNALIDMYVKS
jgi:pentatricopeptide repeat protein